MAQGEQTAIGTMTARYVLVLGMLAALAVVNHFLLEEKIRATHASAQVLRLTGRQRFLLHHSAAQAERLAGATTDAQREQLRNDLADTIKLMETSHHNLVEGNEAIALPGAKTPEAKAIYFDGPGSLDELARNYFEDVKTLMALPAAELRPDHPAASSVSQAAIDNRLLSAMDRAMEHHQTEQDGELSKLRQLQ